MIENSCLDLNFERFNLISLMSSLMSDFSHQADKNTINIKFYNDDGKEIDMNIKFGKQGSPEIFVFADKDRIVQMLSNILINFTRFTIKELLLLLLKGLIIKFALKLVTLAQVSRRTFYLDCLINS
jgi:signal transduction histidine kinase